MIIIYQHLGLGDHIICNGLIRKIIQKDHHYVIFCKNHNFSSVEFMFRDIPNLKVVSVTDDSDAKNKIITLNPEHTIYVGHKQNFSITEIRNFLWDESFYVQLGVPFRERWSSFYVERDFTEEKKLYDELNNENDEFALIHNKDSYGIDRIDYEKIDKNLKKVFVEKRGPVFHYITLIERAKEIHCIDSSFKHLVESVSTNSKLYYHRNFNPRTDNYQPHTTKKEWIMV